MGAPAFFQGNLGGWNMMIWPDRCGCVIPGSSRYVKCLPFGRCLLVKRHEIYTQKEDPGMSVQLPPHIEGNVEQLVMVTARVSNPHLQAIEAIWKVAHNPRSWELTITIVANLRVFGWSSKYRGALNKQGFQGDVRDVEESQIIYPKGSMGVLRKGMGLGPSKLLWEGVWILIGYQGPQKWLSFSDTHMTPRECSHASFLQEDDLIRMSRRCRGT